MSKARLKTNVSRQVRARLWDRGRAFTAGYDSELSRRKTGDRHVIGGPELRRLDELEQGWDIPLHDMYVHGRVTTIPFHNRVRSARRREGFSLAKQDRGPELYDGDLSSSTGTGYRWIVQDEGKWGGATVLVGCVIK